MSQKRVCLYFISFLAKKNKNIYEKLREAITETESSDYKYNQDFVFLSPCNDLSASDEVYEDSNEVLAGNLNLPTDVRSSIKTCHK